LDLDVTKPISALLGSPTPARANRPCRPP